MPEPDTVAVFRPLLERFDSLPALARGIDVPVDTVRAWARRDSIPSEYWQPIADWAKDRGVRGVSEKALRRAGGVVAQRHRQSRTRSQRLSAYA